MRTSANFGLPLSAVEKIRAAFRADPRIEKAVLYGSRAKGNFKPGSDIDLALEGQGLDSDAILRIAGALDDLLLPYEIDLSLMDNIENSELIDHIRRVGVVFYERAP